MKQNNGFSLIELVLVMVILGILAASAIPSFVDVGGDARKSATTGIAGALGSASAINYAVRSIKVVDGVAITNCQEIAKALVGGIGSEYKISSKELTNGAAAACTVTHTKGGETATFIGHGIS